MGEAVSIANGAEDGRVQANTSTQVQTRARGHKRAALDIVFFESHGNRQQTRGRTYISLWSWYMLLLFSFTTQLDLLRTYKNYALLIL